MQAVFRRSYFTSPYAKLLFHLNNYIHTVNTSVMSKLRSSCSEY
uniref:Uncharacterized protein n=1 Tax=Arundo donax TaxID=35708 RepID=A0A0A9DSV9_ARUDO